MAASESKATVGRKKHEGEDRKQDGEQVESRLAVGIIKQRKQKTESR